MSVASRVYKLLNMLLIIVDKTRRLHFLLQHNHRSDTSDLIYGRNTFRISRLRLSILRYKGRSLKLYCHRFRFICAWGGFHQTLTLETRTSRLWRRLCCVYLICSSSFISFRAHANQSNFKYHPGTQTYFVARTIKIYWPMLYLMLSAEVAKRSTAVGSRSTLIGVRGFESLPPHPSDKTRIIEGELSRQSYTWLVIWNAGGRPSVIALFL